MTAALIVAILAPTTAALVITAMGVWAARGGLLTVRITRPTPPKEH